MGVIRPSGLNESSSEADFPFLIRPDFLERRLGSVATGDGDPDPAAS
jgi:hypothetical protein